MDDPVYRVLVGYRLLNFGRFERVWQDVIWVHSEAKECQGMVSRHDISES